MERKDIQLITDDYMANQFRRNPDLETTIEVNRNELEIIQAAVSCYLAQITISNTLGIKIDRRAPLYEDVKKVSDSLESPVSVEQRNLATHKDELSEAFQSFKGKLAELKQHSSSEP